MAVDERLWCSNDWLRDDGLVDNWLVVDDWSVHNWSSDDVLVGNGVDSWRRFAHDSLESIDIIGGVVDSSD